MSNPDSKAIHVDFSGRGNGSVDGAMSEAKEKFAEHGCFLAKGLFSPEELEPTQDYIRRLIKLRADQSGLELEPEPDGDSRFDDGFMALTRADRNHGAAIFDACRRLLPLHQLSVDDRLVGLARNLIGTDTVIASDVKAIRVDHPAEGTYLFDWHQDYPYIMDSEDAVVCWMALHDVNDTNGALRVALGSHELGLLKMRIHDPRNKSNNKQRFMEIADKDIVDDFPQVSVPAETGDALIFSTMALHASQPNRSERARWTAQLRFGNFENPSAVERDWPGSLRDGHWFDEKHPEYVINLDELVQAGAF